MTYSEKKPLLLKDVSTVRKMLEVGVLKRASKAWEGIKLNDELLDRVAFQRVPLLIIDKVTANHNCLAKETSLCSK